MRWANLNTHTCAPAVVSKVGMDGERPAVPVMSVDVEVAAPRPRFEPREDLKWPEHPSSSTRPSRHI
jgi:hypothetical protein